MLKFEDLALQPASGFVPASVAQLPRAQRLAVALRATRGYEKHQRDDEQQGSRSMKITKHLRAILETSG